MSSSRGRKLKPKSISPTMVTPSKKRRPSTPVVAAAPVTVKIEPVEEMTPTASREDSPAPSECMDKIPVFKNKNFVHSCVGNSGTKKTRVWKNLKQIIATEKTQPWRPDDVTYNSIDAPPSFKPAKKYSDLSGLAASYTDPQTKLRYATAEEYSRISMMPSDLVSGCLALRKANAPVP
ncbi:INO80 complex subunit C-like [Mytilus trossulus]|uniref:INO80 complex subunit C-like n=1 Tax=Mytilus trossulus TaxID=6551 RepID=UPI0030057FD8